MIGRGSGKKEEHAGKVEVLMDRNQEALGAPPDSSLSGRLSCTLILQGEMGFFEIRHLPEARCVSPWGYAQ